MENVIQNPGLQHITEMILLNLDQRWSNLSGDYNVLGDYLVTHWKKKICQLAQTEDYTQHSWREASHLKLLMRQRIKLLNQCYVFYSKTNLIGQNCYCFGKIMRCWELAENENCISSSEVYYDWLPISWRN